MTGFQPAGHRTDSGAGFVEYVVLLAIIVGIVVVLMAPFSTQLSDMVNNVVTAIAGVG